MASNYPRPLKQYGRIKRILFPSPAEREFVHIVGWWWLLFHGVRREEEIRGYVVDFVNVQTRSIVEVDGRKFHDIVRDQQRDEHLHAAGYRVFRIPAWRIWKQPDWVRTAARRWLN